MTTDLESRLGRYGSTLDHAIDECMGTPPVVPLIGLEAGRRSPRLLAAAVGAAVIAALAVVTIVLLHASDDGRRAPSNRPAHGLITYRSKDDLFSVRYPASWQRARRALTPEVVEGKELFSVGTFALVRGAHGCTHGPTSALADLPKTGALVSIQERDTRMLYPARQIYPPANPTFETFDDPARCITGSAYEHWAFAFDDHQRTFQVLVAFGLQASPQTKEAAWKVLNSFTVRFRPAASVPNHVDAELYGVQAGGPTTIIVDGSQPNGYSSTVVRKYSDVCIDVRPTSQPSGPEFCGIPADAPWTAPVEASVVELNGVSYLVGSATEEVTSLVIASAAQGHVVLVTSLPFPTLQFFAQPVGDGPLTLQVTTRDHGTTKITINP
jgi:hypothetical protein